MGLLGISLLYPTHDKRETVMLDICICTHNPRLDVLGLAVASIAAQAAPATSMNVILIDNGSTRPLPNSYCIHFPERASPYGRYMSPGWAWREPA